MITGILGRKIGMTQLFAADGTVVPVTVVEAGPCLVVQRKTKQNDGYDAVQLGLVGPRPSPRRLTKAARGHFEKAGVPPTRTVGEVRCEEGDAVRPGRQGPLRHLQPRRARRRRRRLEGQGLPGGHQAPRLRRRRRDPRVDVPPAARLDRRVGVSLPRLPRDPLVGPDGREADDDEEPRGRQGRRREPPDLPAGRGPRGPEHGRQDREEGLADRRRREERDDADHQEDGSLHEPHRPDPEPERRDRRRGEPPRGDLRGAVPPPHRVGGRPGDPRARARGDPQDEGPLRGLRLGQEALQAEAHGPGPPGRRPPADPPPRRHGPRAGRRARTT